jgi:LmbE family N-acetylglucosaminyl deacetylase
MLRSALQRGYRLLLSVLYSRSRFKLFLNSSLPTIDLRMLTLASTVDYFAGFVRPIPVSAPFGRSVLVVAPHQDDEIIGCGGAAALQVRAGGEAAVVLLQDGADGCEELGMSRAELRDLRNEESRRAAAAIGLPEPVFLNFPDLATNIKPAAEQVRALMVQLGIDAVFIPFVLDAHPDHRVANYILAEALKTIPGDVRVLEYEVWGMCIPNVLAVIDPVMDDKLNALACFTFANGAIDYVHSTKGLNMFHSKMLGSGEARYIERFFELPRIEYIELVEKIRLCEAEGKARALAPSPARA